MLAPEFANKIVDDEPPVVAATKPGRPQKSLQLVANVRRSMARNLVAEEPGHGAPANSEIALATSFALEAESIFRWSPGLGWMAFDGARYVCDDKMQRMTLAKSFCARAAASVDSDAEAKRIASKHSVSAVVSLAQADPRLVVPVELWDCEPMVLNTPNGIIDLSTGELRNRESAYFTQVTRVGPDANAKCPTWHQFMESVFCGDPKLIDFMRRLMGYLLTGDRREQLLFFFYGEGANGKSVLVELLLWLSGSYALKLPANALMATQGGRHPTELAQLRGKRLAVSSELDDNSSFNEPLVKELTGDVTMTARHMRQDFFQFSMQQKHVIVGNSKPRLRGGDPAMARRMVLIPFNACFKGADRDPQILEKLKAEATAILHWIAGGAKDWKESGLAIPACVRKASEEYMADQDDLQQWIEANCELTGQGRASDLYGDFERWKRARGEFAPSQTVWGSRVTALAGVSKRRSNGVVYAGLQLKAGSPE